ncbi:hypothetical protein BN946_scf184600.g6 [Trametes cinnabarina]|uniref:RRM domain-containing protein n=1 Tax=Pycnoporus cinnabarinus TaxID=5643 RepID=A0A060SPI7_PYCCI|nr:hypothetical protein BN946_scf184600.g6 [Trametes cinnabarina]
MPPSAALALSAITLTDADLKDLFRRAGTVLRADVSLGPDNRSRGYGTVLLATAEDAGRAVDMFNGYTWQTRTLEVRPDRMGEELNMPAPGPTTTAAGVPYATAAAGVSMLGMGALDAPNLGVFGTPLVPSMSPVPSGALSGTGTAAASVGVSVVSGSALASPAPTLPRFNGSSPFGAGVSLGAQEDASGSRPGTSAQASRNLFVGNLPFHIQWQDLKDLFRQAGAVQRADVALGADGRSRGFGTVSFSNEADAERAVRMFNGYEYNGRPLKVHFDKFAAPSNSLAPLVGPGSGSTPHSPASFAFSNSPIHTHSLNSPVTGGGGMFGQQHHQPSLSRSSSLAQQLLQQQLEHGRGSSGSAVGTGASSSLAASRRPSGQLLGFGTAAGVGSGPGGLGAGTEADSLSAQLAQKLSLASASPVNAHSPTSPAFSHTQQTQQPYGRLGSQQHQQQHQHQHYQNQSHQHPPSHIPIPPVIQSPYTFDFLHSGPTTPYDVYDLGTYQRMSMGMDVGGPDAPGYPGQGEPQAFYQSRPIQQRPQGAQQESSPGFSAATTDDSPSPFAQQQGQQHENGKSRTGSGSNSASASSPSLANGQAGASTSSQAQPTSPTSSRSHATPQQQYQTPQHHHHHPAHPGPIALPPPPPVTAFPIPPPHTLSPHYASPHMPGHHPMSPMHHPLMGMSMPMMTPHGLPPITPSMPSFTFLPQPSPGLPSPAALDSNAERPTMHGHMQHVMTPFSPFSPGVTMSPGAFWGRPGTGANPYINPAVGAPVRPGYYAAYAQEQQQQQQQQQQQGHGEQERRPPDGYFPPVAVSMAMAQGGAVARDEPAGYFPWVPPASHEQSQRSSGLANEILRDDSSSAEASSGSGAQENKESPSASEVTATTAATTERSTESSRGTSWHTDSEGAVDDALGPALAANGHANGYAKPRAYSVETGASSGTERGELQRADSDPIRTVLGEQRAS